MAAEGNAPPVTGDVLAIDLGGTHLRAALVSPSGAIAARRQVDTPDDGPAALLECVSALVSAFAGRYDAVAVAAPGPLDPRRGVVLTMPNLRGFDDYPLVREWRAALGVPVWLHNDANLAALGEWRYGAGRGAQSVVYLTVSTGIGGGVILHGEMWEGHHGLAGELGHVVVADGGPRCNLGHSGCLEALASGTAIARAAGRELANGRPSTLGRAGTALSAESVAGAAAAGDELALAVLATAGRYLGVGVGSLINVFDPEIVIVGGGVTAAWDLLAPAVTQGVAAVVMAPIQTATPIVQPATGDNAGLLGAAAYAFARRDG
jgi:glucokinase